MGTCNLLHVRKRREDKGDINNWAADARALAGLSAPELARRTSYSVSAIAKVEGGSNPDPSPAIIRAIFRETRKAAAERNEVVPEPPGYGDTQGRNDVAEAIRDQTQVLKAAIAARDQTIEDLLTELRTYREMAAEAQIAEKSLIEALPQAIRTALETLLSTMREGDPERGLPVLVGRGARR